MRIHLGGHLSWYDGERRDWLELVQPAPISLGELATRLGLPQAEVALISVNRRLRDWDGAQVTDADTVEFFPPMGGG